jgi:hypothetical protein
MINEYTYALKLLSFYRVFQYSIVAFVNEESSMAVVPNVWITGDICYWPPYKTDSRRNKAALEKTIPDVSTWEACPIKIIYKSCK